MPTENPFAAPESPTEPPLASPSDQATLAAPISAPAWWLCTWLGTAAAGAVFGAVVGLMQGFALAVFVGLMGFVYAFSAGFVISSLGLLPLLLLRWLLPGRWLPLTLAAACGGATGQFCIGWPAACAGAVGASLSVLLFSRRRVFRDLL